MVTEFPEVAALWFPDWPVQAACLADESLAGPVACVQQQHIAVCNREARKAGVRRGMRIRNAQALCPGLVVVDVNEDREGALFSAIVDSLDDVTGSVEVIRPGLAIFDARAAVRFHGNQAIEMATDAVARRGVDVAVGMADEIATAIIAARVQPIGVIVPHGQSVHFLESQPIDVLSAEPAFGVNANFVHQCKQLGLRTLGELKQVSLRHLLNRFGENGSKAFDIANARADKKVSPQVKEHDLTVAVSPAEPIVRVDAAAFAARQLAAKLHAQMSAAGVVCVRLKIRAEFQWGTVVERIWRTREALTEEATAERVRWQLDGWLTTARATEEDAGLVELVLEPIELHQPEFVGQLWGSGASDEQAKRVITRVQSMLGVDRVVQPHIVGGRGAVERIQFLPYGEETEGAVLGYWPGCIPPPLPARQGCGMTHPAARIRIVDNLARLVIVTAEALLSAEPCVLAWGRNKYEVTAWAGPWPVDTLWWEMENPQRIARLQIVGRAVDNGELQAWLLQWSNKQWRVEATYG
ncbi:MAG: DNA polymerase Y family protein [Corynebacterium sp.]|nr:DNA polymerase Y family protein [Corynebacterium sp.]